MDPKIALSMEEMEMERMRRNISAPSLPQVGTTVTSSSAEEQKPTQSIGADLISFLESPPPVQNQWSLFRPQQRASSNVSFESQSMQNKLSLGFPASHVPQQQSVWTQQTRSKSFTLKPAQIPQTSMRRTGSGSSVLFSYAEVQSRLSMDAESGQKQRFTLPTVNQFGDDFVSKQSTSKYARSHGSSPVNTDVLSSHNQPSALDPTSHESLSTLTSTSPGERVKSEADQVDDVFDRWLSESSVRSEPFTAESTHGNVDSSSFILKEWDPLLLRMDINDEKQIPSKDVSEGSGSNSKQPSDSQQHEEISEMLVHSSKDFETASMGDTSKQKLINSVARIHNTFPFHDTLTNPGYLISPMMPKWQYSPSDDKDIGTVKVSITTEETDEPVVFTCNVDSGVEHIVSQALCIAHEDISQITTSDYRFRVQGRQEFLMSRLVGGKDVLLHLLTDILRNPLSCIEWCAFLKSAQKARQKKPNSYWAIYMTFNVTLKMFQIFADADESDTPLRIYEYVQDCIKFDEDVSLQLVHKKAMNDTLIRTETDMNGDKFKQDLQQAMQAHVTWDDIQIAKDVYFTEVEKLQSCNDTSPYSSPQQCDRVHQAAKAVIQLLGGLEMNDVTHAMMKLKMAVEKDFGTPVRHDVFNADGSASMKPSGAIVASSNKTMSRQERIGVAVENLTSSLLQFIDMYAKAIQLDSGRSIALPSAISCSVQDLLTLNVVSVHRLAHMWKSMYDEFYVSCQLFYGNREIVNAVKTKTVKALHAWKCRIVWDGWLTFHVKVCDLPRETKLCLTLLGYPVGRDTSKPEKNVAKELTWTNVPIFNHRGILQQGGALYGMWSASNMTTQLKASTMCSSSIVNSESTVMCIQLISTQSNKSFLFPPYSVNLQLPKAIPNTVPLSSLDEGTQQDLSLIMSKNPMKKLADHEKELLWKHRYINEYVCSRGSLARILRSVPAWSPRYLDSIYQMLKIWPSIEPIEAFELLSIRFPDMHVRNFAVRCIGQATEDEIHDYLVQLTQALKYEMFHDSSLSRFLIRSALGSIRIAHKLYWLLSENLDTAYVAERYRVILSSLELAVGARLRKEFSKESYLVKLINRAAETVKYTKDSNRNFILQSELEKVEARVKNQSFRLPTNPALVANGIDVPNSSYFTSNAIPLRLAFNNVEKHPKHFNLMFKVGDDLRQDVLTMQLVTIMDKLWLAEGLDLKMVTFACLSTGKERGFIELVSDSITLREIQSSYGLTGAFKDRPIAEWLQKHNPTACTYEKAEENFTLSCAGYCVATYVLGICDRHNDNIMLRKSGHLFHIDFARFLGHAQMFGNIKRDRAPFVLTSDMAYVINGGDRQSSRFHDFVDICCRAFNIIRNNYHIFVNLLSLMIHSGIPELKCDSDLKYVYDALKPGATEEEATTMFTRLIEASLSSSFTKINFFIHNLAQLRFLGNENGDKNSLSFTSKTHTAAEDGYLVDAVVVGYNKRYNPEKYYIFCIRLKREMRSGESYVYRTYSEFAELHNKLCVNFPSFKIPSFPSKVFVGRSQIKQVAERRKVQLNAYLHSLLRDNLDVSRSDLVYTFFHPMLRDEQGGDMKALTSQAKTVSGSVKGEIKLSIHHKNNALYIMIMHCRNLESPDGSDPDPYVKTKLLPDSNRSTKRKTKVARRTLHPTFNEMLVYDIEHSALTSRKLYVSVWNYEQLNENDFLGSVTFDLGQMNLQNDNTAWYPLSPSIL